MEAIIQLLKTGADVNAADNVSAIKETHEVLGIDAMVWCCRLARPPFTLSARGGMWKPSVNCSKQAPMATLPT